MAKFVCEAQGSGPEAPGPPVRKQEVGAARLKGKGGKRGPPQRCDTHHPTTANKDAPLPGDHSQLCQVAISQSPLSACPDGPEPLAG
jgi:hypothetical protein